MAVVLVQHIQGVQWDNFRSLPLVNSPQSGAEWSLRQSRESPCLTHSAKTFSKGRNCCLSCFYQLGICLDLHLSFQDRVSILFQCNRTDFNCRSSLKLIEMQINHSSLWPIPWYFPVIFHPHFHNHLFSFNASIILLSLSFPPNKSFLPLPSSSAPNCSFFFLLHIYFINSLTHSNFDKYINSQFISFQVLHLTQII